MRTFDDIIVPPSRRKENESPTNNSIHRTESARPPSRSHWGVLGAALVVIIAAIGALYYFSTTSIEVTPNTFSAAVQSSFTVDRNTGDLTYEIVTAQKVASQSVASTGTKTVSTSASGPITIYNTQSKAQRLITNTRFATTAGLIFRIHAPVTIPGGTAAKPGSIAVTVYADKPGDSYNVGPTSFTIPGFAGTPQETLVYARSTNAMTGGASGEVPVVDTALESKARAALMQTLAADLSASLQEQIPSGYVLVPNAATTTYESLVTATSATNAMADVKEQGTITAVVFPNSALASAIAKSVTNGTAYDGVSLILTSTADLRLSAVGLPNADATTFSFTLTGTAPFRYTIDQSRIAAAVAGKTRAEAEVALSNYVEVKQAVIILRPFWRQAFPQDPSTITVTTVLPQ